RYRRSSTKTTSPGPASATAATSRNRSPRRPGRASAPVRRARSSRDRGPASAWKRGSAMAAPFPCRRLLLGRQLHGHLGDRRVQALQRLVGGVEALVDQDHQGLRQDEGRAAFLRELAHHLQKLALDLLHRVVEGLLELAPAGLRVALDAVHALLELALLLG